MPSRPSSRNDGAAVRGVTTGLTVIAMTVLPGALEEAEVAEVQPRVLATGRSVEMMRHKALLSSIRSTPAQSAVWWARHATSMSSMGLPTAMWLLVSRPRPWPRHDGRTQAQVDQSAAPQ